MKRPLHVVVTGDVDSGKSTLIGRMLYEMGSLSQGKINDIEGQDEAFEFAYLLDSFEEERKGSLTIDTTQAFCATKKGREFIFIDVPGHRDLIKNMLSGSSYADMAMFIVDVKKPIEEQAKRHALVLDFLGIEDIVIAFNKMDAVSFDSGVFRGIKKKIYRFFIDNIGIRPKCCVPISAKCGDNLVKKSKVMPWYKGKPLVSMLNICHDKKIDKGFRFFVQDIYNFDGKVIAAGRIGSGKLNKGEKVVVLPSKEERIVFGIEVFNKRRHSACAPESIGLRLNKMSGLARGQIICKPGLPDVVREIRAKIFFLRRLSVKESLTFRCLSQETVVNFKRVDAAWDVESLEFCRGKSKLDKNTFAQAVLISREPVVVERFHHGRSLGRFILEKNREIYAVGTIL